MAHAQQLRQIQASRRTCLSHRAFCPAQSRSRGRTVVSCARAALRDCTDDGFLARRDVVLLSITAGVAQALIPSQAQAGFKKDLKKRKIPIEDYTVSDVDGLKYYDIEKGRGKTISKGDTVTVHYDCVYRGIDAVSSRYARTLGGNRTVAEPYEFVAGEAVRGQQAKKSDGGSAGGLFVGGGGPKPPPALSTAVIGMKPGGRRIVLVDVPELGYLQGNQEIPAGEPFQLKVEVLSAGAGPGGA